MDKLKYKVNVLTDLDMWGKEEIKTLILNYEDLEHLKAEMQGNNIPIWEYETIDKKIIADDMIRRIISIRKINKMEYVNIKITEQDLNLLLSVLDFSKKDYSNKINNQIIKIYDKLNKVYLKIPIKENVRGFKIK